MAGKIYVLEVRAFKRPESQRETSAGSLKFEKLIDNGLNLNKRSAQNSRQIGKWLVTNKDKER